MLNDLFTKLLGARSKSKQSVLDSLVPRLTRVWFDKEARTNATVQVEMLDFAELEFTGNLVISLMLDQGPVRITVNNGELKSLNVDGASALEIATENFIRMNGGNFRVGINDEDQIYSAVEIDELASSLLLIQFFWDQEAFGFNDFVVAAPTINELYFTSGANSKAVNQLIEIIDISWSDKNIPETSRLASDLLFRDTSAPYGWRMDSRRVWRDGGLQSVTEKN